MRGELCGESACVRDENISRPDSLVQIVNQFFDYKAPHIQEAGSHAPYRDFGTKPRFVIEPRR